MSFRLAVTLVLAIIQALPRQVDFAMTNPDPVLFNALARGLDIKLLARSDLIETGQFHSPRNLQGKPVGVPAVRRTGSRRRMWM